MATTTKDVPIYFPQKRKKKRKTQVVRSANVGETKMNEVQLALMLVEHGLEHRDALDLVIESDVDKAAKKMAKKATDDPEKQKELEAKFKEKMGCKKKK